MLRSLTLFSPAVKEAIFSNLALNTFGYNSPLTLDQYEIPSNQLQWEEYFIYDSLEFILMVYDSESLGIYLPEQVTVKIEFGEEAVQGSTAQAALKKAVLETGYEINVPQFIETGGNVIINTSSGEYGGRSKNVENI